MAKKTLREEINIFGSKVEENRIIIGNSATQENHHLEVFDMLEHLKNEDIKIFCPLSYGDNEYGKKVAEEGARIFGEKFVPIFDFMNYEEYLKFLSEIKIGIFYNDRQQAMVNIEMMIIMGKKVFIRKNTSMWLEYLSSDLKLFDADQIKDMTIDEFSEFDEDTGKENNALMRKRNTTQIECWKNILEDLGEINE